MSLVRNLGFIHGAFLGALVLLVQQESKINQLQGAQDEINNFVEENPSLGHYECRTKSGPLLNVKGRDFQSGRIPESVVDPVRETCKAALNASATQPGFN